MGTDPPPAKGMRVPRKTSALRTRVEVTRSSSSPSAHDARSVSSFTELFLRFCVS
jgi:hypothetical protein